MKNVISFNSAVSLLIKLSAVAWIKIYQLRFIYFSWANEFCTSLLCKTSFGSRAVLLTWVESTLVLFTCSNSEIFPMFMVVLYPSVFSVEGLTSPFILDYHTICLISVATQKLHPVVDTPWFLCFQMCEILGADLSYNWACTCYVKSGP